MDIDLICLFLIGLISSITLKFILCLKKKWNILALSRPRNHSSRKKWLFPSNGDDPLLIVLTMAKHNHHLALTSSVCHTTRWTPPVLYIHIKIFWGDVLVNTTCSKSYLCFIFNLKVYISCVSQEMDYCTRRKILTSLDAVQFNISLRTLRY